MEKETDLYRVFDERHPEKAIFVGSHDDCGDFMDDSYPKKCTDFNYIWAEPCI